MKKLFALFAATLGLVCMTHAAANDVINKNFYRVGNFTTNSPQMVGAASTNWTGNTLEVYAGEAPPLIMCKFVSTNENSAIGVTFSFVVSQDNTNWSTLPANTMTFALNTTNPVVAWTNWGTAWQNVKYIKGAGSTTTGTTNGVTINWVRYAIANPVSREVE